jgi:phosphomannomutase
MVKDKLALPPVNVDEALSRLRRDFPEADVNDVDGVKFDLAEGWVHLRRSNTEPILRIYAEAGTAAEAEGMAATFSKALSRHLADLADEESTNP